MSRAMKSSGARNVPTPSSERSPPTELIARTRSHPESPSAWRLATWSTRCAGVYESIPWRCTTAWLPASRTVTTAPPPTRCSRRSAPSPYAEPRIEWPPITPSRPTQAGAVRRRRRDRLRAGQVAGEARQGLDEDLGTPRRRPGPPGVRPPCRSPAHAVGARAARHLRERGSRGCGGRGRAGGAGWRRGRPPRRVGQRLSQSPGQSCRQAAVARRRRGWRGELVAPAQ